MALLGRLREAEPHRFNSAHLSALRRRVQQWRGIIGNNMVYAASESSLTDPVGMRVMAPIEAIQSVDCPATFFNDATGTANPG